MISAITSDFSFSSVSNFSIFFNNWLWTSSWQKTCCNATIRVKNKLSVLGVIFDCKLAKTELQCLLFSYNQGHLKISKDVLVLALQIAQEGNYAGRFTAQKTSLGMVKTSYFLYKKSMVEPISSM